MRLIKNWLCICQTHGLYKLILFVGQHGQMKMFDNQQLTAQCSNNSKIMITQNDVNNQEYRNKEQICNQLEKELQDIMVMFSEERSKNEKVVQALKRDNKKLKRFKNNYERDLTSRVKYKNNDTEAIERIVTKEKEKLIHEYNSELCRREKHIKMLSDSVRTLEDENKHMLEIIYNKEQEIDGSQRHLDTVIANLRDDNKVLNKRLSTLQKDYEYMLSDKNMQISTLKEMMTSYSYKAKSEIRTSRVDYSCRRETAKPTE